jgi:hypothetical protein
MTKDRKGDSKYDEKTEETNNFFFFETFVDITRPLKYTLLQKCRHPSTAVGRCQHNNINLFLFFFRFFLGYQATFKKHSSLLL